MNGKLLIGLVAGVAVAVALATCLRMAPTEGDAVENAGREDAGAPRPRASAADGGAAAASPAPAAATAAATAADPSASGGGRAAADGAAGAPVAMSADGIQRVSRFADGLAARNERQKEFLSLARNEAQDPEWSPQMQDALADSVRDNFGQRSGLAVSDVRCTRTICTLSAVVGGSASSQASDWQALMRSVMNEPWFGDQFFDASTTMGTDDEGLIYLTYFVRKTGE